MSKRISRFVGSLALSAAVTLEVPALARYEAIDLGAVPAAARQAAEAGAPGARLTRAAREIVAAGTPSEKTFYKLSGSDGRGEEVGVHVGTDNRLYGVDRQVPLKRVSKAAVAALKSRRKPFPPGFKPAKIVERSNYGSPVLFIFEGRGPKGGEVQVLVSPDGKQIQVQDKDQ